MVIKITIFAISLCLFACSDDWSKEQIKEIVKQCENDSTSAKVCECTSEEISSLVTYTKWKTLNSKDIDAQSENDKELIRKMSDALLDCRKK